MSKVVLLLLVLVCALSAMGQSVTQGSLFARGKEGTSLGICPLKNTAVKTEISGFVARVRVKQEFQNPFSEPIEAVYTFPLSQKGAVDEMTMTIGSRVVRGKIMKRDEARQIYEQAKSEGKTASLLDQERPNIFTQSVANIMPGETIMVEISYVETLRYEDGAYEFVFPMTVGPRYSPASVSDATKISPPVTLERSGHDISIEVNLNAGVPVEEIRSTSHEVQQLNLGLNHSQVTLKTGTTIPNKDFVLRYDVTGGKIQDAVLAHRDERGGFFTMILQPPDKIADEDRTPKEIVFVLDTSGSMSGFPIEKAKEAMKLSLEGLYPDDRFNLITFAGDTHVLFEGSVSPTQENMNYALSFLESRRGGGGTEMMKAIRAALDPSDSKEHVRIVCFMTDGYVGNEDEIIAEVGRHPNARVFSFGIGNSVNRYLLDKMAEVGKGEVEYVSLSDDGSKAAKRFYERVRTPLLTDLSIDWNGMPVGDVYPNKLTDLFSAKPVIVLGRYTKPFRGVARLKGKVAGQEYSREIAINLPEAETANDSLASLWARRRVDELSSEKLRAANSAKTADLDKWIMDLGLEFGLMTSFTSFVAVEDRVVNQNGKPVTVRVPVAMPDGVDPVMSGASVAVTGGGGGGGGGQNATVAVRSSRTAAKLISHGVANRRTSEGSGSGSGTGTPPNNATIPSSTAAQVTQTADAAVMTVKSTETAIRPTVTSRQVLALPMSYGNPLFITPAVGPLSGASFMIDGLDLAGSPIFGRVMTGVRPDFPAEVEKGEVDVEIEVDPEGNVVKANAIAGPDELRKAAVEAAKLTKFTPVLSNGQRVRFGGTIAYTIVGAQKTDLLVRKMTAVPPTEEDKRAARLGAVMHFWVYGVAIRATKGVGELSTNESKFIRDGKASIRVELNQHAEPLIGRLSHAGLEIESAKGKVVTGRIALNKLSGLIDIGQLVYIAPRY